jgi:hypothetical protein
VSCALQQLGMAYWLNASIYLSCLILKMINIHTLKQTQDGKGALKIADMGLAVRASYYDNTHKDEGQQPSADAAAASTTGENFFPTTCLLGPAD